MREAGKTDISSRCRFYEIFNVTSDKSKIERGEEEVILNYGDFTIYSCESGACAAAVGVALPRANDC
jgi:hypothetical protein